jgi:hypothetical protein
METAVEGAVRRIRTFVESKVSSLNPVEVAESSSTVPELRTALQLKDDRELFFDQFAVPARASRVRTYSDQLFDRIFKTDAVLGDHRASLSEFFGAEVARVARLLRVVSDRLLALDADPQVLVGFSAFMSAASRHVFACQEGVARLAIASGISSTSSDYLMQLSADHFALRRTAMLKSVFGAVARFPLTSRQPIFRRFFDAARDSFVADAAQRIVPLLLTVQAPVEAELRRLATRFGLDDDLSGADGQRFLYFANKAFEDLWPLLNVFEMQRKSIAFGDVKCDVSFADLTQDAFLHKLPIDIRLEQILDTLEKWQDDDVKLNIRDTATYYNTLVGNQCKGQSTAYEKNKPLIPLHHLVAWYELRFLHSKFLASAILLHLNWLEWVAHKLTSAQKINVKCRGSPRFPQFLEIYDHSGAFLYESAYDKYLKLIALILGIGSSFVNSFESNANDPSQIVDRNAVAERFLEYEFQFLNAKRALLQPLLEAVEHCPGDKGLVKCMFSIIRQRPRFNLKLYHSYDETYKLAISILNKKAAIVRSLVNMQVHHEQQVGTQAGLTVPLFDRPILIQTKFRSRPFGESMFVNPFEVYESLNLVIRFLDLIPRVTRDFCESGDIKLVQYGGYMECSILVEVEKLLLTTTHGGLFPYDRAAFNFRFLLSDSVNSVMTAAYVNRLEPLCALMTNMNEGRKLRFVLSARRFVHLTWKIQSEIISTNLLQGAYFDQCDILGVSERGVLLAPFRDHNRKDGFDFHSGTNDKVLDFALTEFQHVSINFHSMSTIKDIICSWNFDNLISALQFQRLQNAILETALRFNAMILDSDFFISYFGFAAKRTASSVFLTNPEEAEKEVPDQATYFRQYLAGKIFYDSPSIWRDNSESGVDRTMFSVPIKQIKTQARSFLGGQLKQRDKVPESEVMSLYIQEMIDSFVPFAYRVEISRICIIERGMLRCHALVDTFLLGPEETVCLVNEAGSLDRFFYVPSWVECVTMLQTAQLNRQGVILKPVHYYLATRLCLLAFLRFESSMDMASLGSLAGRCRGES